MLFSRLTRGYVLFLQGWPRARPWWPWALFHWWPRARTWYVVWPAFGRRPRPALAPPSRPPSRPKMGAPPAPAPAPQPLRHWPPVAPPPAGSHRSPRLIPAPRQDACAVDADGQARPGPSSPAPHPTNRPAGPRRSRPPRSRAKPRRPPARWLPPRTRARRPPPRAALDGPRPRPVVSSSGPSLRCSPPPREIYLRND